MAAKKMKIAQFSTVSIDDMVEKCIELILTPAMELLPYGFERKVKKIPVPTKIILFPKFVFLTHVIITKCSDAKDNKVQLHSKRLQNVLGKYYRYMLCTLKILGVIDIDEQYEKHEYSRRVSVVNWDITYIESSNKKVAEFNEKWEKYLLKDIQRNFESKKIKIRFANGKPILQYDIKGLTEAEKNLYKNYNESLAMLKIRVSEEYSISYVNSLCVVKNAHKYHYCIKKLQGFKTKENKITSIDEQGRIYNYLTNLKKELKCLFNIKYQIDIANCHPLLICKILIDKYKINKEILEYIYNYKIGEGTYNVIENLCNEQIIRSVEIPIDVVRFICSCSKGMLWDELHASFPMYSRSEIKRLAFGHIFYNGRNIAKHTDFGKRFIDVYPNVYGALCGYVGGLPLKIMKLESDIIRKVLEECYLRNWKVVSIHDAIVVLDVVENENTNPEELISIIYDVFSQKQLRPSVHVDDFPLPKL